MAEYPSPKRVRQKAELRAYAVAVGLDPKEITEFMVEDNPPYAPKMHFLSADGGKAVHEGLHTLTEEQRAAVVKAGDEAEQLWRLIHEVPAFRPKEWETETDNEGPRLDE